ncbi:MAG: amino acid ABC transporter permease [Alphaproteobacteria bacterium]|nr:amino acid ABC transporter permease [Alphaproteobacteria bacterium]
MPPVSEHSNIFIKLWVWLRTNLFSSFFNTILTFLALYLLYLIIPPLFNWLFLDANWHEGTSRADCQADGACWTMIRARFGQFIYGFYPESERWRVNLVFILMALGIAAFIIKKIPGKTYTGLFLLVLFPFISFWLLYGWPYLPIVETRFWGGLMLNVIVGTIGIVASLPLGIFLALGRRSNLPVISMVCTFYIEFVRAVPLITVLFMSSVMLPLFLPEGVTFDKLLRAIIGIALFSAAYMAEVIRGGLQAIPRGQFEAAKSLGLNYWQTVCLIILPQALRLVIPGIVNTFISLFKDTTLVTQIGIFDLLGVIQAATRDANWAGLAIEGYVFTAFVFWIICFSMSRYSQYLEKKLNASSYKNNSD